MPNEFGVTFRGTEAEADPRVALSLSAEGVGSALFLLSFLCDSRAGMVAGLLFVAAGAGALFTHLGHPLRCWRVITKTSTAWISRGAVFTTALLMLGIAALLLPDRGLGGLVLRSSALVCAFAVMLYAGVLYATMSSVPFWNTSLLPLLFAVHSLASGSTVLLGLGALSRAGAAVSLGPVSAVAALLLLSLGLTWVITKPASRSAAARESIRRLTHGPLRALYLGGAVWSGLIAPVALIVLAYLLAPTAPAASGILLSLAMMIRLAGDFGFRSAVLKAGVYEPVI
jgi:formate-dependent nitrite reductase membrane component NrfD